MIQSVQALTFPCRVEMGHRYGPLMPKPQIGFFGLCNPVATILINAT